MRFNDRVWVRHFIFVLLSLGGVTSCESNIEEPLGNLANLLPIERRIDWSPGIQGGIPTYPVAINVRNAPYNAKGDGVSDDTAALKQAIADCPNRSAIYIPAGTYRLTSRLTITMKSIVLRGDGPDKTYLKFEAGDDNGIVITGEGGSYLTRKISSGYTKGSTSLVMNDRSGLSVGDYVLVSQDNDPAICENMQGYQVRAVGQWAEVTGISGNTLILNRPLYFTYNSSYDPQIEKYAMAEDAGVEDLRIALVSPPSGSCILLWITAHCWVKNVESSMCGSAHVTVRMGYGNVIRSSYFHHAEEYGGGAGYGVFLLNRCTDNLVEDNIFYHLRHAATIEWGGCGNVIAYNYATRFFDESYPDTNWLMQSIHTHGGHPYMNLFEGNVCPSIVFDNAIGSSRHNTAFRNHAERHSEGASSNLNAIEVQMNNLYENVIGNVLCSPGDTGSYEVNSGAPGVWKLGCDQSDCGQTDPRVKETLLRHGNYDYVTGTTYWDSAIKEQNLPDSLYLPSKPGFFGSLPWPLAGPDLTPMVRELPAKIRFEGRVTSQVQR